MGPTSASARNGGLRKWRASRRSARPCRGSSLRSRASRADTLSCTSPRCSPEPRSSRRTSSDDSRWPVRSRRPSGIRRRRSRWAAERRPRQLRRPPRGQALCLHPRVPRSGVEAEALQPSAAGEVPRALVLVATRCTPRSWTPDPTRGGARSASSRSCWGRCPPWPGPSTRELQEVKGQKLMGMKRVITNAMKSAMSPSARVNKNWGVLKPTTSGAG